MGLWQTGYLDKIDTGYDGYKFELKPKTYHCSHCEAQFLTQDELLQHRFQEHPSHRPTLLLRGEELPSSRKVISRCIQAEDILAAGCEKAKVDDRLLTPNELGLYLAERQTGIRSIVLYNGNISSEYELLFQIPHAGDLAQIDILFFEFTANGILDRATIDRFVESAKQYPIAKRYLDGIAQYLYGVLAKDQKGGTCLDFTSYKEKYNQSLDTLREFETPLARIISGIVNFNLNVFNSYTALVVAPKLQASMRFFQDTLFGADTLLNPTEFSGVEPSGDRIPLDSYTDRLITWSLAKDEDHNENLKLVLSFLNTGQFSPEDQLKLLIIAVTYALRQGEVELVRDLVRPITNHDLYGDWAQNIMNHR